MCQNNPFETVVQGEGLAMLGVLLVWAAASYPLRPLIPVSRDASSVFDHPRHVHEVPAHERRVPVREVVLGSPGAGIQVRRTRTGLKPLWRILRKKSGGDYANTDYTPEPSS